MALIFLPRRPRIFAAALVVVFQLGIMLTGSYNWFNLLTVLLCLFLLDDQALHRILPRQLATRIAAAAPRPGHLATALATVAACIVVPIGLNLVYTPLAGRNLPIVGAMTEALAPLLIVNPYGLFATTTTTRPVIVFEGSDDNEAWHEYALPFLPGPVDRAPAWSIPYQPRLDWQLWFAAYGSAGQHPWTLRLLQRLLDGSPRVRMLFAQNPFPAQPPKYARALLYDYRFGDARSPAEPGTQLGRWWMRRLEGTYYPSTSLADIQRAEVPAGAGALPAQQ